MDFSKKYFDKSLDRITLEDLNSFFQIGQAESNTLEFKSSNGELKNELRKCGEGLCSMLNANGGLFIWGAPIEKVKDGNKICQGSPSPVKNKFTRDQLINQISDSISPLASGINVERVEVNGKYIYVFEVSESISKPHQYRGTYWIRLDGQKRSAPHYLVEAMIKQIKYPLIEGFLKIVGLALDHHNNQFKIIIQYMLVNKSETQIEDLLMCSIFLKYPKNFIELNSSSFELLHFGTPYSNTVTGRFDANLEKIQIVMNFRGKSSPAKVSVYDLDLNNFKEGNSDNLHNRLVYKTQENLLMSEMQKIESSSQDDLIAKFRNS